MPGDETHGFDLAIEFAEQAYQEILSAIFDSEDFLSSKLLDPIHADDTDGFRVNVLFDRPTDAGFPAGAQDPVDLRIEVGDVAHPVAALRMVVGVDVDRGGSDSDLVALDFANRLYLASAKVHNIPVPGFATLVRDRMPLVPILPIPVDRGATSSVKLKRGDVWIVDDASPADLDASAFMLTFGGGTTGTASAFTRSFISPGGNGGIAVAFDWLCRVISPKIDEALELGGAFTDCRLTRTVTIDEDDGIDLTKLEMTLEDGFIRVAAGVKKSGFCYDASGTVAARIMLAIQDGELVVRSEVEDPVVDIDVPWYCYLAGAVIGGLVGLLFGVVGSIVGAILVPLILWVSSETVEGVVQSAIDRVADALNEIAPNLDVPAVGLNLIFSDVFIDDVTIGARVTAHGKAPIRCEGFLDVPNGAFVDLDRGVVGGPDLPSQDLAWRGELLWRHLDAVCGATLARTDRPSFDEASRPTLYGFAYDAPNPVSLDELATFDPFSSGTFRESMRVFGVRTNEGRWSMIQAVDVRMDGIRVRYRTYEKRMPGVEIHGGWSCERPFDDAVDPETIVFHPGDVLTPAGGGADGSTAPDPCAGIADTVRAMVPAAMIERRAVERAWAAGGSIGRWTGTAITRAREVARFDAVANGLGEGGTARWSIQGETLEGTSGSVEVEGVEIGYETSGMRLTLTTTTREPFEFLLDVRVEDRKGASAEASRCVRFEATCTSDVRVVAPWKAYLDTFRSRWGVAEVQTPVVTGPPPPEPGPELTSRAGSRTST